MFITLVSLVLSEILADDLLTDKMTYLKGYSSFLQMPISTWPFSAQSVCSAEVRPSVMCILLHTSVIALLEL